MIGVAQARRCVAPALAAALVLLAEPAASQELGLEAPTIEIHGFVSQGFILSTENDYLADSSRGSFELAEAGLNFTTQLSDRLRAGVQLFARDLGRIGGYEAKLDWFYMDYTFADWLGVRAGRTKLPFGLYNDASDVDAARAPILLPQSVYPIENRDFLLAQTGLELYGYVPLGAPGTLEYRAYVGTIFLEASVPASAPYEVESLGIPYVVGGRVIWELPVPGLRLGGSVQGLRLDGDLAYEPEATMAAAMRAPLPDDFDGIVSVELPAVLWVASAEYALADLQLAAEYSRWHVETKSSAAALFPPSDVTSERAYALAAWRLSPWLTPALYWSVLVRDVRDRKGRDAYQHDVAGTLRFDVGPNLLLKLEGHLMHGTAALSPAQNGNRPRASLAKTWGVFLAKATAYF